MLPTTDTATAFRARLAEISPPHFELAQTGRDLLAPPMARGLSCVAKKFKLNAADLGLAANPPESKIYTGYQPLADSVMWVADKDGHLKPHSHGRFLSREALLEASTVSFENAQRIAAEKFGIMVVGRSGFVDEAHSRIFQRILNECLYNTMFLLQRAGFDVESLAMMTSMTAGSVDFSVRRAAAHWNIPALAFMNGDLAKYADPADPFVALTVDTDSAGTGKSYSETSIGLSCLVLSVPGGPFALFNDVFEALKLDKPIVFFKDDRIPALNVNVQTGQSMIGNHVLVMLDEKEKLTDAVIKNLRGKIRGLKKSDIWNPKFRHHQAIKAELVRILNDDPCFSSSAHATLMNKFSDAGVHMDPIKMWKQITVVASARELATCILNHNGQAITDLDSHILAQHNGPLDDRQDSPLKNTRLNLALTGRSQMINKASGQFEMQEIDLFLEQVRVVLARRGYRAQDIGVIHGSSNYGADGAFLRHLSDRGFPSLGIVKPEWAEWTADEAKRRSDYVLTADTYEAFSEAYVAQANILVVFEGNDGVMGHIKAALKKGIPVVIVPMTNDPLISDFFDVQKGRVFENRMSNVGKWLFAGQRREFTAQVISQLSALTHTDLKIPGSKNKKDYFESLQSQFADNKRALKLIQFALDMLDLSTTVEHNPGKSIQVVRSPSELVDLIQGLDQKKNGPMSALLR